MSAIKLTLKLFRHNLRSTAAYLCALILSVAMYYNFAVLKYSPEALGGRGDSTAMMVCAMLMSIVMLCVLFAFIWSSSRFFLQQRKKEIGIYALCGVPMGRVGRVFLYDSLLTGVVSLGLGILLGTLLTKLFLMGAAMVIKLEASMGFTFSIAALVETCAVVGGIFVLVAIRNAITVRRSKLIDLLQGMRVSETPPKRRVIRAVLAVLALGGGYGLSLIMEGGMVIFLSIPVLLLVIAGTYWAFEALLPAVLSALTRSKAFFYKGVRMIGISNLWYRLRSNYRNLALTSVLSATAIVTLCTALTMSAYVGAREGQYSQRLVKAFSLTAWMGEGDRDAVEAILKEQGVDEKIVWIPVARLSGSSGSYGVDIVMEQSAIEAAAGILMPLCNLPVPDLSVREGEVIRLRSPDYVRVLLPVETPEFVEVGGETFRLNAMDDDFWPFGGNEQIGEAYIVPDGSIAGHAAVSVERRAFVGVQASDTTTDALLAQLAERVPSVAAQVNQTLTTQSRMLYGTLSYLGLILFCVFALLTGCALLFKQLGEATADRPKYQAMICIGATRADVMRAVGVQVGLSLIVPLLLGFVHAAFAVRVMGYLFILPTMQYLLISVLAYALVVCVLYAATMRRFLRIVTA